MRLSAVLLALFRFLLPPTLIALTYLYTYPFLAGCSFPPAKQAEAGCVVPGKERPSVPAERAPFRLLALADPQLEGDTSVPEASWSGFARAWGDGEGVVGLGGEVVNGLGMVVKRGRKKLDLWGNDRYLAHVFRMVRWWTRPTHVVVLGDLLGSQWIGDEEFGRRAGRFWGTVFEGMEKVPLERSGLVERLQDGGWEKRVIAVAGNHDVGYAGDLDEGRIERFEQGFGKVNWEVKFRLANGSNDSTSSPSGFRTLLDQPPELRLVILNSMNLDEPAYKPALRDQSLSFLDSAISGPQPPLHRKTSTILLTHIPLRKPAGICVDAPYFSYFPSSQGGGIQEQNHLSQSTSQIILDGLTTNKRGSAIVLNGHDHEGCDTVHSLSSSWEAKRFSDVGGLEQGLREVTVRSMMGDFGGNAGFLSAWFSEESGNWEFAYESCVFGVQHIWWGIWVLAIIEGSLGITGTLLYLLESYDPPQKEKLKKG